MPRADAQFSVPGLLACVITVWIAWAPSVPITVPTSRMRASCAAGRPKTAADSPRVIITSGASDSRV